jgi:hypothetical protein
MGKVHQSHTRSLGWANVIFMSTHPQAATRGETAHRLFVIDELQDQDPNHLEAVFKPMRTANIATGRVIYRWHMPSRGVRSFNAWSGFDPFQCDPRLIASF